MEWKAQRPTKPGLYFASFQGRAVARVRCEVNEWGELIGKVLLKRPEGVPDEFLKQVGFEEEISASLDFYEFWMGPLESLEGDLPTPPRG